MAVTARRQPKVQNISRPGRTLAVPKVFYPCFDGRQFFRMDGLVCHESSRGTNCVLWPCQLLVDRVGARNIHAKNMAPGKTGTGSVAVKAAFANVEYSPPSPIA